MIRSLLLLVALAATATSGCSRAVPSVPPVVRPSPIRVPIVVYERFRLGTFDFGEPAEGSDISRAVTDGLPAALLTELRASGRFSLFEGGNLRNPEALDESTARERVDGYLSGTITRWDLTAETGEICAEIRLANAWSHEVLYGVHACVNARVADGVLQLDRAAITAIAQEVSRSIAQIENANVMSAEGRLLLIDRGTSSNVARGMVAYLRGTGDLQSDEQLHVRVAGYTGAGPTAATPDQPAVASQLPAIVAEVVIVSVDEHTSVGELVRGTYALPGDTVFFK